MLHNIKYLLLVTLTVFNSMTIASEHTVTSGESLSRIIVNYGFQGSARDLHLETLAIFANNKTAFHKNNINLLIPGSTLILPDYTPAAIIAGQLQINQGTVKIIRKDSSISVDQSTELFPEDIILTMSESNCKIEMRDGARFELGPNSKFSIDEYDYKTDEDLLSKSGRIIVTLFKGIARAVTGNIGKINKQQFQFKTVIATIGIRGTDYTVRYCEGNNCGELSGTSVAVIDGAVLLKNDAGEIAINKGEFAIAESSNSSPVSAPMPEGFLDINRDNSNIETEQKNWWQKLLDFF